MNNQLILLKRKKSFPINSRPSNRYSNFDNYIKNNMTQKNMPDINNISIIINNDNININDLYPKNIKEYKSANIKNIINNKSFFLDLEENLRLQKENISLYSSLHKAEEESKLKDEEINGYKEKVKALLKQVKEKNNILFKKNDFILKLYEENKTNKNLQNFLENNLLNLSNYKLSKCLNKNKQLQNQIKEQNKYILMERNKFLNCITKIKNDCNKIREDSIDKDKQIKSLLNVFIKKKNNSNDDLAKNNNVKIFNNKETFYQIEKFGIEIQNNGKINNKNFITKNYFMIKNKVFNRCEKDIGNNLENQKKQSDKIIELKEEIINNLVKEIDSLKLKINNINKQNLENEKLIQKKEEIIKKYENKNNIMNSKLNKIKKDYDLLLKNSNKNEDNKNEDNNNENLNKIKNLMMTENIINDNKNKIKILNEEIIKLKEEIQNQKNEINEKKEESINNEKYINELKQSLKNNNENFKKEINKKNEINKILKENLDQINNELNKMNNLRIEDINVINKLNINLQTKKDENNGLKSENLELIEKIKINEEKNNNLYKELKKENDRLNKTNSQLNEYITKLNEQLNSLNLKYKENKHVLNEKDIEINNLKEVSQALLDKQKNELELKDKNEQISPDTHFIISIKKYSELTWYLVSIINPYDNKISNEKKNNYNNYKWITELVLPKSQLHKYNIFKDDQNKNNYSNNNSLIDKIVNYYDNRELSYKNEITKLETKIRGTEELQSKVNNIRGISLENESDFIDFDETGGENMIKFLKDKNILKKKENEDEDILNDIPGNESDLDEIKGLKTLTKFLKKDNKEKEKKINNLTEKIKELINNLKYDTKIKPQLSQILELLGFPSNTIQNILNNNKGFFTIK